MNVNLLVIKDVQAVSNVNSAKLDDNVISVNGDNFRDSLNNASLKAENKNTSKSETADNSEINKDIELNADENVSETTPEENIVFVNIIPTILQNTSEVTANVGTLVAVVDESIDSTNLTVLANVTQEELPTASTNSNQILPDAKPTQEQTPVNTQNLVAEVEIDSQEEITQNPNALKNTVSVTETDTESLQFVNKVLQEVDDIIKEGKNAPDLKVVFSSKNDQKVTDTSEVIVEEKSTPDKLTALQTKSEFGSSNGEAKNEKSYNPNDYQAFNKNGDEVTKSDKNAIVQKNIVSAEINPDGKIDFKFAQVQEKVTQNILPKQSIFEQIVEQAKAAINKQQNELYVQLKPAHLGGLIISLTMGEQGMMAKLTTGQKDVAMMVQADLTQLQESLREKGINVVHMDVIYDQMANSTSKNNSNNGEQWTSNAKTKNVVYDVTEDAPMIYDNLSMYDVLTEQGGSVEYKA